MLRAFTLFVLLVSLAVDADASGRRPQEGVVRQLEAWADAGAYEQIEEWARALLKARDYSILSLAQLDAAIAYAKTERANTLAAAGRRHEAIAALRSLVEQVPGNVDGAARAIYYMGVLHEALRVGTRSPPQQVSRPNPRGVAMVVRWCSGRSRSKLDGAGSLRQTCWGTQGYRTVAEGTFHDDL